MTARLANGGRPVEPHIVVPPGGIKPPPATSAPIADPAFIALMQDAMHSVTDEAGGTAYWALGARGLDYEGLGMAGKTGTSQVRRITPEERAAGVIANEDLPWRRRDHALFVGYAPYDAPEYAVAVIIEHGGSGSRAAAPPARDILREMVRRSGRTSTASLDRSGGAG